MMNTRSARLMAALVLLLSKSAGRSVWLLVIGLTLHQVAQADNAYLCARLDAIRAEENMPAIGAGIILPDPRYPQFAPSPFQVISCASGVEKWGEAKKVSNATLFNIGSISKPLTGPLIARAIASEKNKPNPRIAWDTKLADFFPEEFSQPGVNPCYRNRTVADLMAHVAGFPEFLTETGDLITVTPGTFDTIHPKRLFLRAAIKHTPGVACTGPDGRVLDQLPPQYSGAGVLIATHMVETITGLSWEQLMKGGSPGFFLGDFSVVQTPYAFGHYFDAKGKLNVQSAFDPKVFTSGPTGHIHVTVPRMAQVMQEFLLASKARAAAVLPPDEWATLTQRHALSGASRLGWPLNTEPSTWAAPVGAWTTNDRVLWHDGSAGCHNYSRANIVPNQNAAFFVMLSADDCPGTTPSHRNNSLVRTINELIALRLHGGDAAKMVHDQSQGAPTNPISVFVGLDGGAPVLNKTIADGQLTTKWAPVSATTATITVNFDKAKPIGRILIVEDEGPRIQHYRLEYRAGPRSPWVEVAASTSGQDPVFPHRIFTVKAPTPTLEQKALGKTPAAMAKQIRFTILKSNSPPRIVEIAAASPSKVTQKPWWHQIPKKQWLLDPGPLQVNAHDMLSTAQGANVIQR
jgi:CubicO group peptidase (beta-lactamase class C family)